MGCDWSVSDMTSDTLNRPVFFFKHARLLCFSPLHQRTLPLIIPAHDVSISQEANTSWLFFSGGFFFFFLVFRTSTEQQTHDGQLQLFHCSLTDVLAARTSPTQRTGLWM